MQQVRLLFTEHYQLILATQSRQKPNNVKSCNQFTLQVQSLQRHIVSATVTLHAWCVRGLRVMRCSNNNCSRCKHRPTVVSDS